MTLVEITQVYNVVLVEIIPSLKKHCTITPGSESSPSIYNLRNLSKFKSPSSASSFPPAYSLNTPQPAGNTPVYLFLPNSTKTLVPLTTNISDVIFHTHIPYHKNLRSSSPPVSPPTSILSEHSKSDFTLEFTCTTSFSDSTNYPGPYRYP